MDLEVVNVEVVGRSVVKNTLTTVWVDGIPGSKLRVNGESQSSACTCEAYEG